MGNAQTHNIVCYVLNAIMALAVGIALFKSFNTSRKISSISDFICGEAFEGRFKLLMDNYFSKHATELFERLRPFTDPALSLPVRGEPPPSDSPIVFG
jgi:hypothetical protein